MEIFVSKKVGTPTVTPMGRWNC